MHFNLQLKYEIYNKNASFWFFVAIPKALPTVAPSRCLAYGTQSVGKRTWVLHGVYFVKGKALQIKNIKIFSIHQKI